MRKNEAQRKNGKGNRVGKGCVAFAALGVLCACLLTGCGQGIASIELEEGYFPFITNRQMREKGYTRRIGDLDSEISCCFQDAGGAYHLYVFACPIRYQKEDGTGAFLDDRLKNVTDETLRERGFVYEIASSDFITRFPQEMKETRRIWLEKDASIRYAPLSENAVTAQYHPDYRDMTGKARPAVEYNDAFSGCRFVAYPTVLGVGNELVKKRDDGIHEYTFTVRIGNAAPEMTDSGYLLLKNKQNPEEIEGIVQLPIVCDSSVSPRFTLQNQWRLETTGQENEYRLTAVLDQDFLREPQTKYPVRAYFPVELRREKGPDSPVYAGTPDINRYLSDCAAIGTMPQWGEGREYIRFALSSYFEIDPDRIEAAAYHQYAVSSGREVCFDEVQEDWCSLTITWNTPSATGDTVLTGRIESPGEQIWDITPQAKRWFADETLLQERCGLLLRAKEPEEGAVLFLSHDSALFQAYTEIVYR